LTPAKDCEVKMGNSTIDINVESLRTNNCTLGLCRAVMRF
jgi:hypothetical protein